MAWDSVGNIVNDAALELGLITSASADVYGETNQNIVQLRALLKSLGQRLVRDFKWSHLTKEHTFDTADGVSNYTLPDDFQRIVDGTAWNRTTDLPLVGPLNAQQWQALKGQASSLAV